MSSTVTIQQNLGLREIQIFKSVRQIASNFRPYQGDI